MWGSLLQRVLFGAVGGAGSKVKRENNYESPDLFSRFL